MILIVQQLLECRQGNTGMGTGFAQAGEHVRLHGGIGAGEQLDQGQQRPAPGLLAGLEQDVHRQRPITLFRRRDMS